MSNVYTDEFKKEAVKLVTEQGYSQAEAGRRLGISAKNINRWVSNNKQARSVKKENATPEQLELEYLRKEIHRLKMEKEILKKAAAFFANEKD